MTESVTLSYTVMQIPTPTENVQHVSKKSHLICNFQVIDIFRYSADLLHPMLAVGNLPLQLLACLPRLFELSLIQVATATSSRQVLLQLSDGNSHLLQLSMIFLHKDRRNPLIKEERRGEERRGEDRRGEERRGEERRGAIALHTQKKITSAQEIFIITKMRVLPTYKSTYPSLQKLEKKSLFLNSDYLSALYPGNMTIFVCISH